MCPSTISSTSYIFQFSFHYNLFSSSSDMPTFQTIISASGIILLSYGKDYIILSIIL